VDNGGELDILGNRTSPASPAPFSDSPSSTPIGWGCFFETRGGELRQARYFSAGTSFTTLAFEPRHHPAEGTGLF